MDTILYTKFKDDITWIKHIGDSEAIGREFEKLVSLGCVPTLVRGQVMRYDYQKVITSRLYELCLAKVNAMSNILPLSKVPKDILEDYIADYPEQKNIINSDKIDQNISMAVLDPEFGIELEGILYACCIEQSDIFTPLIFMREQTEYSKMVPMLTVACVSKSARIHGRGRNIILEPMFNYGVNGFTQTLGEPEEIYPFCEYFTLERQNAPDEVISEVERYNREVAIRDDNGFLDGYITLEQMGWISIASIRCMRYMKYHNKGFNTKRFKYRENLKIKADEWGLDIERINQLIDQTTETFFNMKY